jgi:hypothetical protein
MARKEAEEKKLRRDLSAIVDVYFDGNYTEEQLTHIARCLDQGMSNTEWGKIQSRFKLPDAGREFIDDLTATYWDWRVDHSIAKGLRSEIETAQAQTQRLAQTLPRLRNNRDFFKGVFAYYDRSPSQEAALLDKTVTQLHSLDQLLAGAIVRITEPAHRPSHRAIWQTLRILSNYMASLKRALDDSPRSIAYYIILRADPKVTKPTLRSILKEFVAVWPRWDDNSLYVDDNFR